MTALVSIKAHPILRRIGKITLQVSSSTDPDSVASKAGAIPDTVKAAHGAMKKNNYRKSNFS
jgi:hypothetical protein